MSISTFLLVASALHVMWGDGELDLGKTTAEKRVHRMAYAGDVMKFDRPWEGDGCGYFHVVAFASGDLGSLKGREVTVEFELLDCDLYSFRFTDL